MSVSLSDPKVTYQDAVYAFIDGEPVDWDGHKPPSNEELIHRIHERQRENLFKGAETFIRAFKEDLTKEDIHAITVLINLAPGDYRTGFLHGIRITRSDNHARILDDLASKYKTFLTKHGAKL